MDIDLNLDQSTTNKYTSHMTTIWDHPQPVDRFDQVLAEQTDLDLALAQIPSLFGISKKASYLAYRSLSFTPQQSIEALGLTEAHLAEWHQNKTFADFEYYQLPKLQSTIAIELIRLGFLRNMAMLVMKDSQIIASAVQDLNALNSREFSYFKAVRKHYTNNDLLALEKVINPNSHDQVVIQLSWGDSHQVIEGVQSSYQVQEADNATPQLPEGSISLSIEE